VDLIGTSLIINDVEHFFSYAYWPSLCFPWRNVCVDLLPIFWLGLFVVLLLSCMSSLYILETEPSLVALFANIFSQSIDCLFILFMNALAREKLVSLVIPCLFIFSYISIAWGGYWCWTLFIERFFFVFCITDSLSLLAIELFIFSISSPFSPRILHFLGICPFLLGCSFHWHTVVYSSLLQSFMGFPGGSNGKESACSTGDLGSIPESGSPLEKEMATHSSNESESVIQKTKKNLSINKVQHQ